MIKIETLNNAAYLKNGIPHQKGAGRIQVSGNFVGIAESASDSIVYVGMVNFTEYVDDNDNTFANVGDLVLYLGNTILI